MFVLLCFCGGAVTFLWLCLCFFCDCVFGVVWLCFCVLLVVWLCFVVVRWCLCGSVVVVVVANARPQNEFYKEHW